MQRFDPDTSEVHILEVHPLADGRYRIVMDLTLGEEATRKVMEAVAE